jgi:hypothetical protein
MSHIVMPEMARISKYVRIIFKINFFYSDFFN